MEQPIPMSGVDLREEDVEAVLAVLRSGCLALGPRAREFEELVAAHAGRRHGVAVNSGTSALHLIVRGLGLGPGDEVLVPSFTFAASVNAILYEGATPVFVDVEPDTYNISPEDLAEKVTPRTRAIMVVDVFGHPASWDRILPLAARHGLKVIDDSCEALGATHRGIPSGHFGDAAAFAFYPNKQITTGEGGLLVTDDDALAELACSLRNQGRGAPGAWLEHERLGYSYRMDEMSAALGVSQFRRLEGILDKRARVAAAYTERLRGLPWIRTPVVRAEVRMSWFVYVVTLAVGLDRRRLVAELEAEGIPARAYFPPAHLQPYIRQRFGFQGGELPVTESIAKRTLALPFHADLTPGQIDRVARKLCDVTRTLESNA